MARETDILTVDGLVLYQTIRRAGDGFYWTGSAFEVFNSGHWASYALPLTKAVLSANVQADYHADFPVVPAGVYVVDLYVRADGSAAVTDGPPRYSGKMSWAGTAEVLVPATDSSGFVTTANPAIIRSVTIVAN
jgi:hypothetical protein